MVTYMDSYLMIVTIIMNALVAGLFGALKYYSNTLGPNPEQFDMKKFVPIMILSVIVSAGMIVGSQDVTADRINDFLTANFTLVVFANTVYSIVVKKYFNSAP